MLHKCKSCIRISFHIQRNLALKMSQLESLRFDNLALRRLPLDPIEETCVRTVKSACYTKVSPTPVDNPKLVAYSSSALSLLDLNLNETNAEEFVEYFSGNKKLKGSETAAHCYCGHQFGVFAGQLGDGAAIYLGEVINSKNERWEIQLKGAGRTPFSRTADGRKVLRSSIREFLCSEAMHFLGIPTTRAGTCIVSHTIVSRDKLYDGHPMNEKCAIVLRMAPTFIRFGSFEIFTPLNRDTGKFGPSVGRYDILHTMLDYVIEIYYPEIHMRPQSQVEKFEEFYKEVVLRTARLVAQWQCVGFCHGVLNTDNMSILGLTIDYGPFGFLDIYNPHHICNKSDVAGRYTFGSQPTICKWNLQKFAEAIQHALPLRTSSAVLELYDAEFQTTYMNKMRSKIGLIATAFPEDLNLIQELFDTMEKTGADFTNTFLCLLFLNVTKPSQIPNSIEAVKEMISVYCYSRDVLYNYYMPDFLPGQLETFKEITASHPPITRHPGPEGMAIRNVMSQIRKAEQLERVRTEDRKRYQDRELWSIWLNRYKRRIESDVKSFEGDANAYDLERKRVMQASNPRYVLRNYLAQEAIEKAENGDYSHVQELLKTLEEPFNYNLSKRLNQIYSSHTITEGGLFNTNNPTVWLWTEMGMGFKENSNLYSPPHFSLFDRAPASSFSLKVT